LPFHFFVKNSRITDAGIPAFLEISRKRFRRAEAVRRDSLGKRIGFHELTDGIGVNSPPTPKSPIVPAAAMQFPGLLISFQTLLTTRLPKLFLWRRLSLIEFLALGRHALSAAGKMRAPLGGRPPQPPGYSVPQVGE